MDTMKLFSSSSVARLSLATLLGSLLIVPNALPPVEAVPSGATIYAFAGDDSGGRYAIQSNGNGTFGSVTLTFTKGDNNRGGAVEDFNNDGKLDFLGCDDDLDVCYWFKQDPAGMFTNQGNILSDSPNGFEMGMAADDFNQDGNADVVYSGHTDFMRVLTGNGAGGFSVANTILSPGLLALRGKDTGDLNRDGYSDIVVALATSGEVHAFYNDKMGGFSAPVLLLDTLGSSNDPHAVAVADFTSDGSLDIAAGGSLDGDVSLWTGDGNGVFTFSSLIFDFNGRTSIGNYDFDNDGDQDLLATTQADKKVRYLAGNGNGTFQAPVELGTMANFGIGMAVPPSPPIRSKVQGTAFLDDANGNGVQDAGETGAAGLTPTLAGIDYLSRSVSLTTTSAADGSYSFANVPISNAAGYTLTFTPPANSTATTTTTRTVSIPKENTTVTENFGALKHSQVTGKVWNDANGNGAIDAGETGIAAVVLQLSDTDSKGNTVLLSATTALDGTFTIGGLLLSGPVSGTLTVASPPAGFDATTPEFTTVAITTGGSTLTRNFGYKTAQNPGTISGKVFEDVNQSGFNETEPAIANVEVTLTGKNYKGLTVSETRTSDAAGAFSFTVLPSDGLGYLLSSATPGGAMATCPVSTTIFLGPDGLVANDFCFKFAPPPDPDDDHDGVTDANDLCPATVLPEGVPTEKLLKNHYANTDTDTFFETGPTHADSEFTMADTKGCTCEQILDARHGKKKGHYKFGCPKGVIKKWITTCRNNADDDGDGKKDKDDDDECEDDDD